MHAVFVEKLGERVFPFVLVFGSGTGTGTFPCRDCIHHVCDYQSLPGVHILDPERFRRGLNRIFLYRVIIHATLFAVACARARRFPEVFMQRFPVKSVIQTVIPAALLAVFALAITFPDRVPFLSLRMPKSAGIDRVTIPVPGYPEGISMMFVPEGNAPGGMLDKARSLRIEESFFLARTEVTVDFYRSIIEVAQERGYDFGDIAVDGDNRVTAGSRERAKKGHADAFPAEGVSWAAAIVWCNALSEICSLLPVYRYPDGSDRAVKGVAECLALCSETSDGIAVQAGSDGFRLPTSDEWEFAARYVDGDKWTPGSWPSGGSATWTEQSRADLVAIYSRSSPAPVASVGSNALGLYDMSGNVWEWCFDAFAEPKGTSRAVSGAGDGFPTGKGADPALPAKRVTRGGSWMANSWRIQIGGAFGTLPGVSELGQGFRLALDGRNR